MLQQKSLIVIGIATLTGLIHFYLNFPILETNSDSLNQVSGAYSFSEGAGYVTETGDYVRLWPPLYAAYLALFFSLSDLFLMVVVANSLLLAATSASWSLTLFFLVETFSVERLTAMSRLFRFILALGGSLIILNVLRHPSAAAMFALFFPIFLSSIVNFSLNRVSFTSTCLLVGAAVLLPNAHNMGAILLASAAVPFSLQYLWLKDYSRLIGLAIASVLSIFGWLMVRIVFKLEGSHEFLGFNGASRGLAEAVADLISGVSVNFGPHWVVGAAIILFFSVGLFAPGYPPKNLRNAGTAASLTAACLLFYICLITMFASVEIHAGLRARFTLVAVLIILVAIALVPIPSSRSLALGIVMLGSLPAISSSLRVSKWMFETKTLEAYHNIRYAVPAKCNASPNSLAVLRTTRCEETLCPVRDIVHHHYISC